MENDNTYNLNKLKLTHFSPFSLKALQDRVKGL